MINGEGILETTSEIASPDLLDELETAANASPVSSRYSSCGESEFDRYCSANSVMGTPSVCSSSFRTFNDCIDSEFGSVSSFGIGDDGNLENFSLEGGIDRDFETQKPSSSSGGSGSFGDRRIQYWDGRTNTEQRNGREAGRELVMGKNGPDLYDSKEDYSMLEVSNVADSNMSGLLGYGNLCTVLDEGLFGDDNQDEFIPNRRHNDSEVVPSTAENCEGSFCVENGNENMSSSRIRNSSNCLLDDGEGSQTHVVAGEIGVCFNGLNAGSDSQFDERETGGLSEEEETLSRYEHSEDEDSMFDYGTDNEHKSDSHNKQNRQYCREEKIMGGNSLLLNSSIAFGSEDWDDFEQEMVSTTLPSVMSNKFEEKKQLNKEFESNLQKFSHATTIDFPGVSGSEQGEDVKNISVGNARFQVADESADYLETCSVTPSGCPDLGGPEQGEEVGNIPLASNPVRGTDESAECQSCSVSNVYQAQSDAQIQRDPLLIGLNVVGGAIKTEHQYRISEEVIGLDDNQVLESEELGRSKSKLDPLSDTTADQPCSPSYEEPIDKKETFFKDKKLMSLPFMFENKTEISHSSSFPVDLFEDHTASIKMENLNSNDSYDDVVNEMEEILLDSFDSPRVGFFQDNQIFQSHPNIPSRDGGSTASTSGTDEAYSLVQRSPRIDGIEVVGAKQKKGDVSLGERLVGVKEYTVYVIKVWSGKDQWEVERRYRDFFTLFRRLKSVSTDQGLVLPSPWSSVERESRKVFGNASPDVVAERSFLIQECLRSILHSRILSSPPNALILFLYPQDAFPSSPASNSLPSWSTFLRGADTENISTLGKTISLMVEMRPYKSIRQLLEAQNYTCAGCHKNFDDGKTLIRDFAQSLGWGKPRLCEYTGQLFCSSCHTNDTAILPARVLHHWDFTQYPISQLAKSYLDSIHDQPMLCVSAVNPFLFSKVPAMLHIMNVRKKVGAMLPYVRCPFRRSINKALGSRRYLLESNDFFALRDLIDLSKGAFAALPVMVETFSTKILEHITEQCLICCDVGVPCGARQACNDPSSLIFPFQESESEKCKSCRSVFHQLCFKNITNCPCGLQLRADEATRRVSRRDGDEEGALDLMVRKLGSGLPVGFLSGLFSKSRQENHRGHEDGDTVILMGSLPSTSL